MPLDADLKLRTRATCPGSVAAVYARCIAVRQWKRPCLNDFRLSGEEGPGLPRPLRSGFEGSRPRVSAQ